MNVLRQKEPEPNIENWLISDKPMYHTLAEDTLGRMGEEQAVSVLLNIWESEERRRQKKMRIHRRILITLASVWLIFAVAAWPLKLRQEVILFFGQLPWTVYFAATSFTGFGAPFKARRLQIAAVTELLRYDDPRLVRVFAEALAYYQPDRTPLAEPRRPLIDRLTRLLPNITPADFAALLTEDARLRLREALQLQYAEEIGEFQMAILAAFAKAGNKKDAKVVKKLCAAQAKTAEERKVQDAARECLTALAPPRPGE